MTSTIKVNTITSCGSTLTIGGAGKTVSIACGATTSGMGRAGAVDWCATIYTNSPGTVTGVSGKGYFLNTTSGAITINLPSSPSVGDIISIKDYANTFDTNKTTIGRGGSKIYGTCLDAELTTEGQTVTLIYADSTKGWINVQNDTTVQGSQFLTATGGTITTSGDYKIHTFNADGNFVVSGVGPAGVGNKTSYLVVAGGGGGAGNPGTSDGSSGGGAGGFREGKCSSDPYTDSPLDSGTALTVTAQSYPITVGGGGTAGPATLYGGKGNNSIFSSITSTGGGGGQYPAPPYAPATNRNGGSGAGAAASGNASANQVGTGNQPPVSPAQGNNGGNYISDGASAAGGGGGAGAVGSNAPGPTVGGAGGAGATTSINGSPVQRAGGGAGATYPNGTGGTGGAGGGGDAGGSPGNPNPGGQSATANTGGGGGASRATPSAPTSGGAGGSGVVIIRYKFQ